MADTKLTDLDAITSLPDTALLYAVIDPSTTPVSKSITGANLRTDFRQTLSPGSEFVPPSGLTDDTDVTNIHAARARLIAAMSETVHESPTIYVTGTYTINDIPLVLGDTTDATVPACNLIGLGHASFNYAGPALSHNYMIDVRGSSYAPRPIVSNLYLDCQGNSRGINWRTATQSELRKVWIHEPYEVGLELNGSWKARIADCTVAYPTGIAVRADACNGTVIDNLYVSHGEATAWPATDDTTVKAWAGGNLQTPELNRGLIVLSTSNGVSFRSLCMEDSSIGAIPLISIRGTSCRNIHFAENLYFEGNTSTYCYVYIDGSSSALSAFGYNYKFDSVYLNATIGAIPFIQCDGYVDLLRVDGIIQAATGTTMSAIIGVGDHADNHLYRASVTGARVFLAAANQIVKLGAAGTIETTSPYDRDYQSVEQL